MAAVLAPRPFPIGCAAALTFLLAADPGLAQGVDPTGALSDLAQIAGPSLSGQAMSIIALVTVLSLAPGLAVMVTCFPFIVTVLSILRQAIGLQQSPPNILIISLSLFLTWFIMEPVFTEAWAMAGRPLADGAMDLPTAFEAGVKPFRAFMAARLDPDTLRALAELRPATADITDGLQAPLSLLTPAFMLSEIARAFEIGFLIFLPFLIIDLVVSALLMSMGMMMVPPAIVSLPFKLAFFVVADGWALVSGALVRSYF
ncbi:MAG TPA: flagellar type III secretion system pore protein FliP [Paracoccaceae bacterium]|nr:flagellar type III secretion system pore protein FliP [Paracoccaceae bacterium]